MKRFYHMLAWLTLFSIAMGFLETAVVVYLRELYYPDGFQFPLAPIKPSIALCEILREAATIIMLAGAGIMAGRNRAERFACFVYAFGIWDIFYYVFLKALLGWPESLLTWDILFLIPIPWVGPVLAPVLISLTLILFALAAMYFTERGLDSRMVFGERMLFFTGCFIVIVSFMWDYAEYVNRVAGGRLWVPGSENDLFEEVARYIPSHYNWNMFMLGESIILTAVALLIRRMRNKLLVAGRHIPYSNRKILIK
ncbi:MAG: hypothetical protein AB1458_10950 [Bacteroidota bacterium]